MSKFSISRVTAGLACCVALTVMFFEVSINPQFSLPTQVQQPKAEQEARYADCYRQRDAVIHERAFSTIDNPDVQREFISSERDAARAACRDEIPEQLQTETMPFRFNLIDLKFRY